MPQNATKTFEKLTKKLSVFNALRYFFNLQLSNSRAAGTMIYVVIQELLPEAQEEDGDKTATLGFIAGFLVMMILDVSLG